MDVITEKKWFVYIGDRHEGPFSLEDIQEKMRQGLVASDGFVWAEGMSDWKTMPEVPEFQTILSSNGAANGRSSIEVASTSEAGPEMDTPWSGENTPKPDSIPLKLEEEKPESNPKPKKPVWKWLLSGVAIFTALIGAYTFGVLDPALKLVGLDVWTSKLSNGFQVRLQTMADKYPALSGWVSPLPRLSDVSQPDYEELKNVVTARLEVGGPRFGIALSHAEEWVPSFYIASNLPDGVLFQVFVIGVTETLLNQISFVSQVPVTLERKLGRTGPIRASDGKPVPRGEYGVYITIPENQLSTLEASLSAMPLEAEKRPEELPKDYRVLASKTLFLGGTRDTVYATRLKDFHDKLRLKATGEISEVRQFMATLESQLTSTTTKFALLRKAKTVPKQRQAWDDFHDEWTQLEGQLDLIFQKWSPEVLSKDFYYGPLYRLTQKTGEAIEKVHGLQHGFFTGVRDPKTFEIQLGEATSSAESALSLLKAKLDQVEKLPPTLNGMPRRDGL